MAFAPSGSQYRSIPGNWGAFGKNSYAALTTALSGANNDLTWTTVKRGLAQNSVTIRYVVAGNSTPLSVSVTGTAITVNVATDGGGAATSTATAVKNAVNAHATAGNLVQGANATGNDGTGVVTALSVTSLAGGTDWTIGTGR